MIFQEIQKKKKKKNPDKVTMDQIKMFKIEAFFPH